MSQFYVGSTGGGGGGDITVIGNSGSATSSGGDINLVTAGTNVQFVGSGSTIIENFAPSANNLLLGSPGTGIAGATGNTGTGVQSLQDITTGINNTAAGFASLLSLQTGTDNVAVGEAAMAFCGTAVSGNVAVGALALENVTGNDNVGIGFNVMPNVSGDDNVCIGELSGHALSSGTLNVCLGVNSGSGLTTNSNNTFLGTSAGFSSSAGNQNTAVGADAYGNAAITGAVTGSDNSFVGYNSGVSAANGSGNCGLGSGSLSGGSNNSITNCIAVGFNAGVDYTTTESSNIVLGNSGVAGESNTMRLGTQGSGSGQINTTIVAGIFPNTVASSAPVGINTSGQMSSLGFASTAGQLLTSVASAGSPIWSIPITGNTSISPAASTPLTTATNANLTTFGLPAGTWAISVLVEFTGTTPVITGPQQVSISQTSLTTGPNSSQAGWLAGSFFTGGAVPIVIPMFVLTLVSTTTLYLVASAQFSAGSVSASGTVNCVRLM